MEYASIGRHELTVCPHCDKLFHIVVNDETKRGAGVVRLVALYRDHINLSPACRAAQEALPSMEELREVMRPSLELAEKERQARLDGHPNNGTHGYWLIEGIRHEARCKASSAREAVEKCVLAVGVWESPEVTFIGEELPEVF